MKIAINIKDLFFGGWQWHKWLLIMFGVLITILILLVPVIFIFVTAFSKGFFVFIDNLKDTDMKHAILMTTVITLIVLPVNLIFGTCMAWLITRFKFFGRQLLFALVNVPISVSPVVAGLMYLLFYGINGPISSILDMLNIQLMFALPGMVLVTVFVTFPFIVHSLVPVMASYGRVEEEAAILLGASGFKMFFYITVPNIFVPLLHGILLTNARSIGEFGAVSVVSGLIRGETCNLSLQVELLYQEYNTVGAFVAASILALIAVVTLFFKHILQRSLYNY